MKMLDGGDFTALQLELEMLSDRWSNTQADPQPSYRQGRT